MSNPANTDDALTRDRTDYLVDRYSKRTEGAEALMKRVNLSAAN